MQHGMSAKQLQYYCAELHTTYPIICQLHAGYHENATVTSLPVVVANKRTFACGAFALGDAGHAEANAFWLVEWSRVQDSNAIPAGLDLDGEVLLEAHGRGVIAEYSLKGRVFEGGPVDIAGYPIVVKDGRTLCHIISKKKQVRRDGSGRTSSS